MSNNTHPYYKPLELYPDEEDFRFYDINRECKKATRRLRELVPLMEFTQCEVVRINQEETVIDVPLLEETMNQNGTHQASVFYLLADYTAGVAMFGVLPGVYVTGINDRCHGYPVQYWLKSGSVKHLIPAVKRIRGFAKISEEDASRMRNDLIQKGVTEIEVEVTIYEDSKIVAIAHHTMGMYGDLPRVQGKKANMFQSQSAMLSANMITGLKSDELSKKISKGLGKALANRMTFSSPELPEIVKSREISLGLMYEDLKENTQIVVLGLGLNTAPARFPQFKWFGLDLRGSVKQRRSIFQEHEIDDTEVMKISSDLRLDDWVEKLLKAGYDTSIDTVFIIEGLSMCLTHDNFRAILSSISHLKNTAKKHVWVDHVTPEIFKSDNDSVSGFLENMSRLGEPFITGYEDLECLIDEHYLVSYDRKSAQTILESTNSLHELYCFTTLELATDQ